MVFNSNTFLFVFLPAVLILFWLSTSKPQRYIVLTLSGYIFYGYWDWRFCFLLFFCSLVSFIAGLLIDRSSSLAQKRAWVAASVTAELAGIGPAAARHRPPDWDQLLHVPYDLVHRRRGRGPCASDAKLLRIPCLCEPFLTARCRLGSCWSMFCPRHGISGLTRVSAGPPSMPSAS